MVTFHIITIFPDSMQSYLATSVLKRAQREGYIHVTYYDPREYTDDPHRSVDDTPYGGGAGMVMKALPIVRAVDDARSRIGDATRTRVVVLSAKGSQYTQQHAVAYARDYDNIIIIAGRYEGIDDRVVAMTEAEELSVGPYVLTDGELPAMILVSSITRLIPGVIAVESLLEESHRNSSLTSEEQGALEYPHYTKPERIEYRGKEYRVPDVLLSGNHADIERWRSNSRNPR